MPLYIEEHEALKLDQQDIKDKQTNYEEKRISFPYAIKSVNAELNAQLMKDFSGERTGFLQVGPKKWFFPSGYAQEAENFYNFELRNDDVFVVTFPRSGTTLTQEMVWLLCNDLDYQKAAQIPLNRRFPFLEYSCFVHPDVKKEFLKENIAVPENYKLIQEIDYPAWKTLGKFRERRFIKTHLPFSLLPPNITKNGCKLIYVARNPKDVAVSFYHLNRTMRTQGYTGDFRKYWDYFEQNLQPWCPYWEHLKEGWSRRNDENVLFLFYENINKNLRSSIEKVARFLDKSYTAEQFETLENHLKFENFRNNRSVNLEKTKSLGLMKKDEEAFVRKGKTGEWKEYFDQELEKKASQWIENNLKDTDLTFPIY